MNERKDLDRLFQEKFKDFEVAPPEFVWENIQEILQEKKKRRVIPIWFKLSGVAALLVLSGLLATLFFNDSQNPATNAPAVVLDNNTPTAADAVKTTPAETPEDKSGNQATVATENALQNQVGSDINSAVASGNENTVSQGSNKTTGTSSAIKTNADSAFPATNRNNAVAQGDNVNRKTINKTNSKATTNTAGTIPQGGAVAASQNTNNNTITNPATVNTAIPNNTNAVNNTTTNDAVAAARLRTEAKNYARNHNPQTNPAIKNNTADSANPDEGIANAGNTATKANRSAAGQKQQQNTINGAGVTPNEGIAANGKNNTSGNNPANAANNNTITGNRNTADLKQNNPDGVTSAEGIAANGKGNASGNNRANAANNNAATDDKSSTIIDRSIPVTEAVAQTTVDTATVVPENELEKRLQEILKGDKKEDEAVAETKHKNRWNVKPQVAPVFYNSLSSGSPINQQFASNSKSYDNELSIGLGVNYALSDRISIRSGVNSVNLSYATNDIAFYASLNGVTNNIGESKTAGNIVVQNPGDVPGDPLMINGEANQLSTGSMVQKTGYVEVPLEMSYAVINNKFGIDVIGGVSTLFLNQNNVSVVSSAGLSTRVGEAQNLNNVHFSTNVGLGFKYRFWDSFQANFEPMFKYQVNAYSRDAGNFKPYFIGLYTGVSFSF